MEEIEFILDSTRESMDKSIEHLEVAFSKIRAGKASPQMLDNVNIDYYVMLLLLVWKKLHLWRILNFFIC